MARFVMVNRRAGKFHEREKRESREAVRSTLSHMSAAVRIVRDTEPEDPEARRVIVFDGNPAEIAVLARDLPADVILEPEILHYIDYAKPAPLTAFHRFELSGPVSGGGDRDLDLTIHGGGIPLPNAAVTLALRSLGGRFRELDAVSDANGQVSFRFGRNFQPLLVVVAPRADFWTMLVFGPEDGNVVECPPLPEDGPLEWWHQTLGVDRFDDGRGEGVTIGVVDTGCGPHPALDHVTNIGAFINGFPRPDEGADIDRHGSHVCGIIGAHPQSAGRYGGVAPGATLLSARVFPEDGGASPADIVLAIDALSRDHGVDLINMSLGAESPSLAIQDAVQDALERGTLCICAAGNSNGSVEWPGAFPETVAVSALGQLGWGPQGSMASQRLPQDPSRFGDDNLYLANFSCFGDEVVCGAPGVGIISTVPQQGADGPSYAAFGGTSMASPAACGALAALLAEDGDYAATPRDETRAAMARRALETMCRDIGLTATLQGRGVPAVS